MKSAVRASFHFVPYRVGKGPAISKSDREEKTGVLPWRKTATKGSVRNRGVSKPAPAE